MRLLRQISVLLRKWAFFYHPLQDKRGGTAVEFALIMPVFIMAIMAIFEASLFYFVEASVKNTSLEIARQVSIGKIRSDKHSRDSVIKDICPDIVSYGECEENLFFSVKSYNALADLSRDEIAEVYANDGNSRRGKAAFDTGSADDIVKVQVTYLFPALLPTTALSLPRGDDGLIKLSAEMIARVEPLSD